MAFNVISIGILALSVAFKPQAYLHFYALTKTLLVAAPAGWLGRGEYIAVIW